jgi:hypothetical protein
VIVVKRKKLSPAATSGIGIALTLVIAAVGWFLLISPQRSRASSIDDEIADVQAQIVQARIAAEQAENTQPVRTADLFRLTKAMPSDNDIAGVLLELSKTAGETGIVFEQIVPGPTVAAGTFRAQPIELVFTGNFYSLTDFLYRLRNLVSVQRGRLLANGRLFSVDKLQFVEADSKFPNIRALLTVSALLYGTGGEPPPSAPVETTTTDTTQTDTTQTPTEPAPPVEGPSAVGAP